MEDADKIRNLEEDVYSKQIEIDNMVLVNQKLGYMTRLMTEFHLSYNDKLKIAEAMDECASIAEVQAVYDHYHKAMYNKSLNDEQMDFQWSPEFAENLRLYFAVSLGSDPISDIADNIVIIRDYFNFENKIRSTPNGAQRNAMLERLIEMRPETLGALEKIINVVNMFTDDSEDES